MIVEVWVLLSFIAFATERAIGIRKEGKPNSWP